MLGCKYNFILIVKMTGIYSKHVRIVSGMIRTLFCFKIHCLHTSTENKRLCSDHCPSITKAKFLSPLLSKKKKTKNMILQVKGL